MASSSDYSQNMLEDSTNISSEKEIMTKFSEEEQSLIATLFKLLGKRWALIAGRIPGRTAEEIENYCTCFTPKTSSRNDFMKEFSKDEESLIARMFKIIGERWDIIAGRIPGRTAEQIENYWTARSLPAS